MWDIHFIAVAPRAENLSYPTEHCNTYRCSIFVADQFCNASLDLLSSCVQLYLMLLLQVGVQSQYLARRMKRIHGASLAYKSSGRIPLQVARHALSVSLSPVYLWSVQE